MRVLNPTPKTPLPRFIPKADYLALKIKKPRANNSIKVIWLEIFVWHNPIESFLPIEIIRYLKVNRNLSVPKHLRNKSLKRPRLQTFNLAWRRLKEFRRFVKCNSDGTRQLYQNTKVWVLLKNNSFEAMAWLIIAWLRISKWGG